jgi:hypothetical protein
MPKVADAIDPDRLAEFLEFTVERHRIWEKRQAGEPGPWTTHPALSERKFTNVYRVLDYGSQWLFTSGWIDADASPRDQLMRLFLYRHTGRWEAWNVYLEVMGAPPTVADLPTALEVAKSYRGGKARSVFTNAYLVFPQSQVPGTDKLESIFDLTQRLFSPDSPDDLVPDFLAATSQPARFKCLRRNKGVADFMSMQVLTDWGYSPHAGEDREDAFVVPGPGARKGAAALAPGARAEDVLAWVWEVVRGHAGCPTLFVPHSLALRPPSLMDVQNLLCEFSKLVRYTPSGVGYTPAHPGAQPPPQLPLHW